MIISERCKHFKGILMLSLIIEGDCIINITIREIQRLFKINVQ